MSDNAEKKKKKKNDKPGLGQVITSKFKNLKTEFNRIVWPSKQDLFKQTYTVIVTCLIFGVMIFVMDSAYALCFQLCQDFLL